MSLGRLGIQSSREWSVTICGVHGISLWTANLLKLIWFIYKEMPVMCLERLIVTADLQPSKGNTKSMVSFWFLFFQFLFSVNISCNLKAGKTWETVLVRYGQPFPGVPGRGVPTHPLAMPATDLRSASARLCHLNEMGAAATVSPLGISPPSAPFRWPRRDRGGEKGWR